MIKGEETFRTNGYERPIKSVCPECKRAIRGFIYEEDGKIYMRKWCAQHGEFHDIIHVNARVYQWNQRFLKDGLKVDKPERQTLKGCPHDCGLCPNHISTPAICLIDLTNRCNLKCPICFANANVRGYTVEPPFEEIVRIMEHFRSITPNPPLTLQLSGGEPTVRDDLIEIVRKGAELGFKHIMLTTNGLRLAESIDYCRRLAEAGVNAVYLQFDGTHPEAYVRTRGRDLLDIKKRAIENWGKVIDEWRDSYGKPPGGIVLVPTIAKGVNDREIPSIIDFAVAHIGTVVGIVFQPIAMCGRFDRNSIHEMRFTSSELQGRVDAHTMGVLNPWYPISAISEFARLVDWFDNVATVEFSCHPDCGFANWLIIDDETGELRGLKHYLDIDGGLAYSCETWRKIVSEGREWKAGWLHRKVKKIRYFLGIRRFVRKKGHIYALLRRMILSPSYESAEAFMFGRNLMIGSMHFQDPHNMDLERVRRCLVHYGYVDSEGKVRQVPFCTMNAIHRERIEEEIARRLGAFPDLKQKHEEQAPLIRVPTR